MRLVQVAGAITRQQGGPPTHLRIGDPMRQLLLAIALAGASLFFFHRLAESAWGKAMIAVRDADTAARAIGLNPVIVKTAA